MKKAIIAIIITLLVLTGLSFGIAYVTGAHFFDYGLLSGIAGTVIIGVFFSRQPAKYDFSIYITGQKSAFRESQEHNPKDTTNYFLSRVILSTSVIYTMIMFAGMIYRYWDYF